MSSKTRQRAKLLRLTWIYVCRLVGRDGRFHASIYNKRGDLNFDITNFPFLSSNIHVPASPADGAFISELIRYACSLYGCFILRMSRLSKKLQSPKRTRQGTLGIVRSFIGILNMKFPYHKYWMTFCSLTKYIDNPPPITICYFFAELELLPNYERFP